MSTYRRARIAGASYFFTVALADRESTLLADRIHSLRAALRIARRVRPFEIDAMVVLPDHLHAIWTLPPDDTDFSTRWAQVKGLFSRSIEGGERPRFSLIGRRERGIWQRRFWEHAIRDEADLVSHLDYIHFNPVKHGWAITPGEWPYSSFRHFVARGIYPTNWGSSQ